MTCSIWSISGTLTGTTTSSQSGPGSNGNEGVFHIPQSSRTETSLSDGLVSYLGYLLGWVSLTPQQKCCQHILQLQPTKWREKIKLIFKEWQWLCWEPYKYHDWIITDYIKITDISFFFFWLKKIWIIIIKNKQLTSITGTFGQYTEKISINILLAEFIFQLI